MQFFRRGCGWNLHSARAAVAENCRRCCSDNAEPAANPIITVQLAPLVHRASFVSSRQQGSGPDLATAPAAHTARLDEQQRRVGRGHVITQHRQIATGPLNGPQLPCTAHKGAPAAKPPVTHRTIATAQSLRTPRIYGLNQPRVDSLRLSTALGITSCFASIHDGSATPEILQFKEATPDKSQSR